MRTVNRSIEVEKQNQQEDYNLMDNESESEEIISGEDKFRERFPEKKNILNQMFKHLLRGFRSFISKICPDGNLEQFYQDLGLADYQT